MQRATRATTSVPDAAGPSSPPGGTTPRPSEVIPILRIFDRATAHEFYRDFLGIEVAWEHRFEPKLPLYAEVVRDGIRPHLSKHHGDASPGGAVLIEVDDARSLWLRLVATDDGLARPGLEREDWGWVVTVLDPVHHRLLFVERLPGVTSAS